MKHIVDSIFILLGILEVIFNFGIKELLFMGYLGSFLIYFDYIYKSEKLYKNLLIMIGGALILGMIWQQHLLFVSAIVILGIIVAFAETYKIANMWDEYEKKE